jgi:polyketide biosynthesis enoyl-CoA hydratase PksH
MNGAKMYEALLINESPSYLTVTLHRPKQLNRLNLQLLKEIHHVLDQAESNPDCRFVVLQGENNVFCTGMDFEEQVQQNEAQQDINFAQLYMDLLKRFTTTSKVIISLLDDQVFAGGVGLVAASDLVISTSRSQFCLSEALWGLLPACVTPFLIRRIGFQKAYFMTLTTQAITASEAHKISLIDELTDNLDDSLRRIALRLNRIEEETIQDLKAYFRKIWIITEAMENEAVTEISRLIKKPQVQANIKNFAKHGRLPWESSAKQVQP